ncbi:NAD(P)-dependent alcohol dehydrogenase [Roseiconus lacunae]|uniref:NAD(P)-dependent alcohol dehydrogenase n=1 Tax=Roseiconus lacunae TaxID=2605694 RepID=UPI00308A34A8|nr:NAD(P)-dependent alcohol dehydrogenase [Stieleria sp. HD01]
MSTDFAEATTETTATPLRDATDTMRAMVYEDYGDAAVLHEAEIETPKCLPGQVLIQIAASSVNPIDYRLRRGEMRALMPGGFPRVPGYDVAGWIAAAADDAPFPVGQPVIAFLDSARGGASAEYAVCSIDAVTPLTKPMPIEKAAAIPLAGTTALQSLRDHGKMATGDRVLINGASGGVGMFAIQIAKAYGCIVTAVASRKNQSVCEAWGADQFIDYRTTDYTTTGQQWDLIFDAAGKASYLDSRPVMSEGARFVSTEPDVKGLFMTAVTAPFSKKAKVMLAKPNAEDLRTLVDLYNDGKLKIEIDSTYPLARLGDAHRRVEEGVDHGKVVVKVNQ